MWRLSNTTDLGRWDYPSKRFEVWNMLRDFRLRIELWVSFIFVCCVVFKPGMLHFYSIQSASGLLRIPTQIIDYSLPGFKMTYQIKNLYLLSISFWKSGPWQVFYFPLLLYFCYFLFFCHFFFYCLLVDLSFLFLFSCLFTVVWAAKN